VQQLAAVPHIPAGLVCGMDEQGGNRIEGHAELEWTMTIWRSRCSQGRARADGQGISEPAKAPATQSTLDWVLCRLV
jgi:hypothetical protein